MVISKRCFYIAAILISVSTLMIIGMSISRVELEPGTIFYSESGEEQGEFFSPGPPALAEEPELDYLLLIRLLIIVPIIVIILITIFFPNTRKYTLRNLVIVLAWAAFVYFMYNRQSDNNFFETTTASESPANLPVIPQAPMPEIPSNSSSWVPYIVGFTLILILFAAAFYLYQRSVRKEEEQELLSAEAKSALEELKSGIDLRNVILRCYYEMGQIVQRERGIDRKRWMTAREFEIRLIRAGLPEEPVKNLTRLFETVRYGSFDPNKEQEEIAVESLTAIARTGGNPA